MVVNISILSPFSYVTGGIVFVWKKDGATTKRRSAFGFILCLEIPVELALET